MVKRSNSSEIAIQMPVEQLLQTLNQQHSKTLHSPEKATIASGFWVSKILNTPAVAATTTAR